MRRPHIGFIHGSNDRYGASQVLVSDCKTLVDLGYDVTVVVPSFGPIASMLPSRVRLVVNPELAILRRAALSSALRVPRLPAPLRHCDLLVIWTLASLAYVPAVRLSRTQMIISVHEILPQLAGTALARMVALSRARVMANSNSTADWLAACGVPMERVEVVYPIVRTRSCDHRHRPSGQQRILMAGRVNDFKGHMEAVDYCETAREHFGVDLTLTLAGGAFTGQEFRVNSIRTRIENLDWASYVGETDGIDSLLKDHDFLLVASTRPEPFGVVVLEAWASGVRSIVPREGGVFEAGQMVEALSYAPRDAQSFAKVLKLAAQYDLANTPPSAHAPVVRLCSEDTRREYWRRAVEAS